MRYFDDIKDKTDKARKEADQKASNAKNIVDERRDNLLLSAFIKIDDTKTKIKKPLADPETRKEATLTSERRFFICGSCESELGPIEEKQYLNLIKPVLKGSRAVIGIATGNPIMAVSGATGAAKGISDASSVDDGRLINLPHNRIREIKQNRSEGEEFLTQCDSCADWVCMDCWEVDENVCTNCA